MVKENKIKEILSNLLTTIMVMNLVIIFPMILIGFVYEKDKIIIGGTITFIVITVIHFIYHTLLRKE